jgi:hypothetical protein
LTSNGRGGNVVALGLRLPLASVARSNSRKASQGTGPFWEKSSMKKHLSPWTRRFLALLLLPSISLWGASMHSADQVGGGSATNSPHRAPSEREQNGLRGPVKSCMEESTHPAWISSDGTLIPENRSTQKAEYDEQGRTLETIYHNPDGSQWVRKYSYDSTGKLLKISQGSRGPAGR